jgi:hypothetical protein
MHRVLPAGAALALGLSGSAALAKGKAPAPAAPKPAPVAAPAAPAPAEAPVVPPEKVLEKKGDGPYAFRLTLRPGLLAPRRVADVTVEFTKRLDSLDPSTGDRGVLASPGSYAVVRGPLDAKKPALEATYALWSKGPASGFGFHFTPPADGLYDVKVVGFDGIDGGEPRPVSTSFKVGVGTASAQTEVSQVTSAAKRGPRRPVGGGDAASANTARLQKLMEEVGERTLDLEPLLSSWPAKGPHGDAAVEAATIASLLAQAKGLAPKGTEVAAGEFDTLAADASAAWNEVATLASADGRPADKAARQAAAKAAFDKASSRTCLECHAKFRWGVTTDLTAWPAFEQKPWKK